MKKFKQKRDGMQKSIDFKHLYFTLYQKCTKTVTLDDQL